MAKKQRTGDSADVYFDTRTKAVLARTSHNSMANVKEQLASVREVVPHFKKEDIVLVLQHFDNDVPKTIQAIMEDGAADILKEWNIPNKRKTVNNVSKKNKKKRGKQTSASQEDGTPVTNGPQEEHIPSNNNIEKPINSKGEPASSNKVARERPGASVPQPEPVGAKAPEVKAAPQPQRQQRPKSVDIPKQQRRPQQKAGTQSQPGGPAQNPSQEPRERPVQAQSQGRNPRKAPTHARAGHQQNDHANSKPASGHTPDKRTGKDESGQRSGQSAAPKQGQSAEVGGKRERNVSESSSVTDPSRTKKAGSSLDKSSKDLQRTVVSLTRHKNLLGEEIEKAEKRLKKASDDARTSLRSREEELMRFIQDVKRHATTLLDERQHKAFELKQEISRAISKTDHELLELRADIKHFVSERKIDEEIGRSSRFTGNPDILQEAIKNFGEVLPVKSVYSARRHSLTSLTSLDSLSRPTSISEDHGGLLSRSASTLDGSVKNSQGGVASTPATPTSPTTPDADLDDEVAKMAAKMQRSLQRGRGPRNQRQQNDNVRQGRQSSNHRQGQSAKEGSRQDQRGNRGRPDGAHPGGQRSPNDKPHNEAAQQGRRNDRSRNDRPLRSDRGEGGRDKEGEGPRNKDRNIRRREQYRRRHDQGSDVKPEDGNDGDIKKDAVAVPRPDSIPISQNGPLPTKTQKPEGQVNREPHVSSSDEAKPLKQLVTGKQAKKDTDTPLVNGNASSSSTATTPTDALPQRKPREERSRKKVEEVVKEVSSMNGMMNGEAPPVMVNGES